MSVLDPAYCFTKLSNDHTRVLSRHINVSVGAWIWIPLEAISTPISPKFIRITRLLAFFLRLTATGNTITTIFNISSDPFAYSTPSFYTLTTVTLDNGLHLLKLLNASLDEDISFTRVFLSLGSSDLNFRSSSLLELLDGLATFSNQHANTLIRNLNYMSIGVRRTVWCH